MQHEPNETKTYRAIKHSNCFFSFFSTFHRNKCKSSASVGKSIIDNLNNSIKQNTHKHSIIDHIFFEFPNQTLKWKY